MKMVIYKRGGNWACTTLKNYTSYIQNCREIQDCSAFDNPMEIIEYYCKWFGSKEENFSIIGD